MENEKERYLDFEKEIEKLDNDISLLQKEEEEKQISNLLEIRKRTRERWELLEKIYSELTAWQVVQVARHPARPQPQDFVFSERFPWKIAEEFIELHGDRKFGDDLAIFAGFAKIAREKVMIIGHRKGHDIEERKKFNFGCAHPEGYRKALRAMKLAEKYHLPVVSLIDTPGAYPGIGSEERGIAQAIAENLREMSRLKTQIIVVIIGEGGSGGALGIGIGDKIAMLEYAYYSVISPEGCAAILWRDGSKAPEAAEALCLTSKHLLRLGIIDDIIEEPLGGAHRNPGLVIAQVQNYILRSIRELKEKKLNDLLEERYQKFRKMGAFYQKNLSLENKIKEI